MLGDFLIHSGCLKYLLNSSRSCSRARESRVFTAVALKFRISDVSLSEYSSRSRRTNTIFSAGVRRTRKMQSAQKKWKPFAGEFFTMGTDWRDRKANGTMDSVLLEIYVT